MPLTQEQLLAMQEGDVFYMYDRNCWNIESEAARTVIVTVERRDGELVGIGKSDAPGSIHLPMGAETFARYDATPYPLFFATSDELQEAHFALQRASADAIRAQDASSLLNDLFNGWYGECNQSNADMDAMKERIHELFGVTIAR